MSTDMLTLKQAAVQSGKSVSTLRSWIRAGKLKADKGGGGNAPVMVSKSDLLSAMQSAGMLDIQPPVNRPSTDDKLLTAAVAERDRLLADLASERTYYRGELARLQTELQRERETTRELDRQIAALRLELVAAGSHGRGVWGLLTDGIKRISGK